MSGPAPDRFREVDALFDAALDVPARERGAFVDRACAGDADLRGAVLRLLSAHRRSGGFLEAPAVHIAASLLVDAAPGAADLAPAPERVGAYRIVRELGHGGMGAVFLAERDDGQFRQRVALKLIRHAAGASGLVPRFLEERRILALLEHPHIARLLDGGVTAAGLPYFAMEFVDGEPIDRYCDARALPIDGRLALFGRVCEAVQYAHHHLVVHRDLKPPNIFVTADGQLKLLDFGIAKLLDPLAPAGDAPLTRTGAFPMTPEYAAPEQLRGDPVSTATDVYALGVLLYLLLTGRRPHDLRGRSPAEMERIVGGVEPGRPSASFDGREPGGGPRERARARGSTPDRLRRRLRGDIDAIVMTALRKDPARRYQSAAALLDDLQRVRDGRPVLARADGAAYRLRKFVGRHRAGVTLTASLALLLAGAGVRERTLRRRAEAEAEKARAVQAFMVGVFDVADPFAPPDRRPEEVTARALLDRGASRIDSSLAGQPAAQAELRGALGRVYMALSVYDRAEPLLVRSLEQRRALYGPRHPAVAEAMDQLGELLTRRNQFARAEPLLRDALAQRRALLGSLAAATAESLDHLATLLQERSDYAAAEPLFREALATRRALLGSDHPDVALSVNNLALLLWHRAAYDEAARLQREVIAIDERRLGRDHPLTAAAVHNLAQFQQFRGRFAEAESLYRVALAAKRKSLGRAHPSVTVNMVNLAALLHRERDRPDEAEALLREALALDRQTFGPRHGYVAAGLGHLAAALTSKGDLAEAERLHGEALAMSRSLFGPRHASVALAVNGVASVQQLRGDLDGAIARFREARELYRQLYGEGHPSHTQLTINLARALRERGEAAESERLFRDALGELDPAKPPQRLPLIAAQVGLGRALTAQGRTAEALPLLERSVELSRERHGEDHWRTAEARLALGESLAASHQSARAAPLLRAAHEVLQQRRRAQPRLAAQAAAALAAAAPGARVR